MRAVIAVKTTCSLTTPAVLLAQTQPGEGGKSKKSTTHSISSNRLPLSKSCLHFLCFPSHFKLRFLLILLFRRSLLQTNFFEYLPLNRFAGNNQPRDLWSCSRAAFHLLSPIAKLEYPSAGEAENPTEGAGNAHPISPNQSVMPPRRSHKKSRAGCRRCKNRKIKVRSATACYGCYHQPWRLS